MAVDDKQGDHESDASASPAPVRRKGASSLLNQVTTPVTVESSLEAFIAKAKEGAPVDVSSFDPANREESLRKQIEGLTARLAAAEADARAAEARADEARAASKRGPRWGGMIAAFVIGGATMFAVSLLMPRTTPGETAPSVAAPTVTPIVPPTVTPTVTPIETPPAPAPTPAPPPAPPVDPTAAAAVPDQASARTGADSVTKKTVAKRAPKAAVDPAATPPKQPDPPAGNSPGNEELYNPF